MNRRRFLVATIVALGLLTACDSTPAVPHAGPTDRSTTPTASTTPHPSVTPAGDLEAGDGSVLRIAAELDVVDAFPAVAGKQYVLEYAMEPAGDDTQRGPLALDGDGALLTASFRMPHDGSLITQGRVGYFRDGVVRTFSPPIGTDVLSDEPRQAISADISHGAVAWAETPSTDGSARPWRIFARTADGVSRLVAYSEQVLDDQGAIVHGEEAAPTIGGSLVYWETAYPRGPRDDVGNYQDFGTKIMAAPLDGSTAPFDVAQDAIFPAATGTDVYYVRSREQDPSIAADTYDIFARTPDGTEHLLIAGKTTGDEYVDSLTVDGPIVVWVVSSTSASDGTLHIMDTTANSVQPIHVGISGNVDVSTGRVAWGGGSGESDPGEYVYSSASGTIWKLGEQLGLSVAYTSGDYVAWTRLDNPTGGTTEVARWIGD